VIYTSYFAATSKLYPPLGARSICIKMQCCSLASAVSSIIMVKIGYCGAQPHKPMQEDTTSRQCFTAEWVVSQVSRWISSKTRACFTLWSNACLNIDSEGMLMRKMAFHLQCFNLLHRKSVTFKVIAQLFVLAGQANKKSSKLWNKWVTPYYIYIIALERRLNMS